MPSELPLRPLFALLSFAAVTTVPGAALAASLLPDIWLDAVTPAPEGLISAFDAVVRQMDNRPSPSLHGTDLVLLLQTLQLYVALVATGLIVTRLPRARQRFQAADAAADRSRTR
ncbi:hypothetical protein [Silicimonas sp. MF1-12-2]|uniref:hypothetical protein n=1 Tax=Silicimonas sp. MF1-12-2 TaxID=3384793 RepID=UPI0039B52145